jgi:hypothetical protein
MHIRSNKIESREYKQLNSCITAKEKRKNNLSTKNSHRVLSSNPSTWKKNLTIIFHKIGRERILPNSYFEFVLPFIENQIRNQITTKENCRSISLKNIYHKLNRSHTMVKFISFQWNRIFQHTEIYNCYIVHK